MGTWGCHKLPYQHSVCNKETAGKTAGKTTDKTTGNTTGKTSWAFGEYLQRTDENYYLTINHVCAKVDCIKPTTESITPMVRASSGEQSRRIGERS